MKHCMLSNFGWIVEGEIMPDATKEFIEESNAVEYYIGEEDVVDVRKTCI